jgi:ketosteroid isomerase-like protein
MRPIAVVLVLALAASEVARAQEPADSVARRILDLDQLRFAADLRGDAAALDSLLADDVTYVRSSGAVDGKAEYLRALGATGSYALDSLVPVDLSVRVFGETAVVTGRLIVKLRAQPAPYVIRFTDVWARRRGRWQLVAFQATRLP